MEQNRPRIRLGDKLQLRSAVNPGAAANVVRGFQPPGIWSKLEYARSLRALQMLGSVPVTGVSSFMALVAALNPPFKPITLHRPWSLSAGSGATASVEVHRYVPGRNFDLFNDVSPIKLRACGPDARKTGDFYAIKRLKPLSQPGVAASSLQDNIDHFTKLATELRILAHPDLHGHPNLVYLFGVVHSPSQDHSSLSEPSFVLQEGDCGDLFNLCRAPDLTSNLHTLVEVKMSLCFDIACGLEALHKHGVVHNDVKPQNILVRRRHGKDTKVKRTQNATEAAEVAIQAMVGNSPFVAMLTDFSGCSIFSDSRNEHIRQGMYTPLWCAPELYSDEPITKQTLIRADIYSAGLVFAFILMEGRDIFTTVVHHGMLHAEDITLGPDEVKRLKIEDEVLDLAIESVASFETCLFGLQADGKRIYLSRETMYAPPHQMVFNAILGTCLTANPLGRVSNASEMLLPWKTALELEFHTKCHMDYDNPGLFRAYYRGLQGDRSYFHSAKACYRSEGKCEVVPVAFANKQTSSNGVFDIQQSFSIFRASLTSGLKEKIFADLKEQASHAKFVHENVKQPLAEANVVSKDALKRAAEYAYQVGIAYLEGFGVDTSNRAGLHWIGLAAQWGNQKAMAAYLPILEAIGDISRDPSLRTQPMDFPSQKMAYDFTYRAVVAGVYPSAATTLATKSPERFAAAVNEYRKTRARRIWKEFSAYSQLDGTLFSNGQHNLKEYFKRFGVDDHSTGGNGWTILHYAAFAGNVAVLSRLIQYWGADVRKLSLVGETALDVAIEAGHQDLVEYLLLQHQELDPPFVAGSCPLQNCIFLPITTVSDIVNRIVLMTRSLGVDTRNQATGRTALMHTLLIEAPSHPCVKDKLIEKLLVMGANPLLTTPEPGTGSPLMFAILQLRPDIVDKMLKSIVQHEHTIFVARSQRARRPEPANELARSFFFLMKKMTKSQRLSLGMQEGGAPYRRLIALLTKEKIARELPYATNAKDHNPLSLACYYGNAEAVRLIIEDRTAAGLALKIHTDTESTMDAIHTAIECGFSDVLDILFPLLMDRPDIANWNVLESAIHHQHASVPRIFSVYEANGKAKQLLDYCDPWGASALDIALEYGYLELARFLLGKGATYDVYRLKGDHSIDDGKQSTLASVIPHMNRIKLLMELKPPPRLVVTESGFNVFHILAADAQLIGVTVGSTEFDDVMNYFHGLDESLVHSKGGVQGMTPFHVVSLHYSEIVGAFLLAHGADINTSDESGYTPLDYLEFHAKGDQVPSGHQLTVSYVSPTNAQRGHTICDYAMAGPAYWYLETKLLRDLKARYKTWGAKTGREVREMAAASRREP